MFVPLNLPQKKENTEITHSLWNPKSKPHLQPVRLALSVRTKPGLWAKGDHAGNRWPPTITLHLTPYSSRRFRIHETAKWAMRNVLAQKGLSAGGLTDGTKKNVTHHSTPYEGTWLVCKLVWSGLQRHHAQVNEMEALFTRICVAQTDSSFRKLQQQRLLIYSHYCGWLLLQDFF